MSHSTPAPRNKVIRLHFEYFHSLHSGRITPARRPWLVRPDPTLMLRLYSERPNEQTGRETGMARQYRKQQPLKIQVKGDKQVR